MNSKKKPITWQFTLFLRVLFNFKNKTSKKTSFISLASPRIIATLLVSKYGGCSILLVTNDVMCPAQRSQAQMTRDEFKIGTLLTREAACCGFVSYCRLVAWNKQRETTIIACENHLLLFCLYFICLHCKINVQQCTSFG